MSGNGGRLSLALRSLLPPQLSGGLSMQREVRLTVGRDHSPRHLGRLCSVTMLHVCKGYVGPTMPLSPEERVKKLLSNRSQILSVSGLFILVIPDVCK